MNRPFNIDRYDPTSELYWKDFVHFIVKQDMAFGVTWFVQGISECIMILTSIFTDVKIVAALCFGF